MKSGIGPKSVRRQPGDIERAMPPAMHLTHLTTPLTLVPLFAMAAPGAMAQSNPVGSPQPTRSGDVVSVSYRYLDGPDALKLAAPAAPGMLLNFGQHAQVGLLFGLTSTTGNGFNSTLNGLALNGSFGAGNLSHYSGMAY